MATGADGVGQMRKNRLAVAISVLLACFIQLSAAAEIYSWVDERGKKHYGDRVPEKYRDQGNNVSVSPTNTFDGPAATPAPTAVYAPSPWDSRPKPKPASKTASRQPTATAGSCKEQMLEYRRSQVCFARCQMQNGRINAAKCSGCKNMTKPRCETRD